MWIRIAVSFGQRFNFIMLMPAVTLMLADDLGAAAAGLALGSLAACEVGASLVAGKLADRIGRRPVLLTAELVAVAAYGSMLAAVVSSQHALALFAPYAIGALSSGFALPASDATVVDRTAPYQRELTYTILYWTTNLALATGALLGGYLYPERMFHIVTIVLAVSVASLLATLFFVPESKPSALPDGKPSVGHDVGTSSVKGYAQVLRDGVFIALVGAATVRGAMEVQVNYYAGIRIAEEYSAEDILPGVLSWQPDAYELLGFLRAENTVLVVVAAFLVRLLVKRVGTRVKLAVGAVLFTIGALPLAVSNDAWWLIIGMAVHTTGELIAAPTQQTFAPALASGQALTQYLAVYNVNLRLGMVLAGLSVSWGAVVGPVGMLVTYVVAGAIIYFLFDQVARHPRVRPAG